jgi:autotransporter-associated beta strand protein
MLKWFESGVKVITINPLFPKNRLLKPNHNCARLLFRNTQPSPKNMQTKTIFLPALCAVIFCSALTTRAGNVFRADNANTLNLPAAWTGNATPTATDVGVWNNAVQINNAVALGADTNWAGVQILDPALPITISAGNKLTLGASGVNMSLATNSLTLSCSLGLGASQTWNVTNGLTLTAAGAISGSGPLTLNTGGNNGGSVIFSVANTYTAGTLINGGVAQPNAITSFGTGAVTNNGGILLLSVFPNAGIMVNAFTVTGTTMIDMFNRSVSDVLDGSWSGNGTILITNDTASGSTLTFGGASGGNMANFTGSIIVVTNASGTASAGTLRFNNGGSQVNTGNSAMSVNLGTNSTVRLGNRDGGTTSIGELTGGPGTQVLGPTGAAGTETWSIGAKNTSVTFAGSFVNNAANEIAALTKVGNGTLTLTGTNTGTSTGPTGATTISAGTLQIGDGNADGTLLAGAVANSAALVFNRPDSYTVSNNISGSGTVTIIGGGTNTYMGTNSSSGTTIISLGDLVLGASGLMSCPISVASAGTFDISQNPTFTLNQTLSGSGTVTGLVTAVGGSINPGGSGIAGTLTLLGGLTESGNINNQLSLSAVGNTNDLINVVGNLTLSGTNIITLSHFGGGAIPSGTYPLIAYSGTLSGDVTNFTVIAVGVTGILTNLTTTTPPEIAVVISPTARGATNLIWKGDGVANNWDIGTSNWVNGATSFAFQAGDSVIFNDSGAPNTNVTVAVTVQPASVTVSNTQQYILTGAGNISGSTGLTKTNAGTLSISATNSYTGPTIVGGGTLEVFNIANGGSPSAIGAATSNPTNLVFYGTVFKYSGSSAGTDRGATLNGAGVTVDVAGGVNLTENGTLTGAGALTKVDNGTLTLAVANNYTGGTVISNGVLATASDTANTSGFGPTSSPISFYGGTLTLFNSTHDDGSTAFSFFNPLVVLSGQTGGLNVFQRGTVNSTLTGGGMLSITNTGPARAAYAGDWSAFTGVINVIGSFRIANTLGYANAIFNLNDGADLDGGTASGVYSSAVTFDIGELDGTSLATIGAVTKPTPYPTWRVGWKNTTSTFAGTIGNPSAGVSSITKVGTGTWILTGQNTFTGSTIVSNGVLALVNGANGDGSIGSSTNIFINSGAFLDVSGRSDTKLPLSYGQVLAGYGTLNGLLDTTSGGTVSAGDGLAGATGTLTVTNAVTLGGTAWMKLNRSGSPTSDKLVSPAGITYGGTLIATNVGAKLQVGDTFTLFGGALSGSFSTIQLPGYYTWDTSQLGVNGTIRVTGILSPPAISSVDFSALAGGTITLNATNGTPNGLVNVLTTTNLTLPSISWTIAASTMFDGNGNLTVPITVDPTLPQLFIKLQAQ